jgi:hypothetical protein
VEAWRRRRETDCAPFWERQESMKCLDKNAYDKSKCTRVRASRPTPECGTNEPPPGADC